MLKVYDKNNNFIRNIVNYEDARIEQELNITDTLLFNIPLSLGDIFEEEGYIETKDHGRFVIKEKNFTSNGYEIVGKYDLEELLEWVDSKSYVTMNIIDMFDDLLEGTGWTAKYGDEWGRNLIDTSIISANISIDASEYTSSGKITVFNNSGARGVRINASKLEPNTQYVMRYQYKKISGVLDTFGGHTDGVWKNNITYIDGVESGGHGDTKSGFVADDENIHEVICYITTPDVINSTDLFYIQPNRLSDSVATVEIYNWKLEKGTQPTPWTPAPEDLTLPKRTVTGTNMSILEIIYKAIDVFKYDVKFNNKAKTIYVADELGADKGVYFHDEVNLKSLNTTSDTYDFATRLIPVGFNEMGIELINDGKPHVENHTYSDKIVTVYWKDERYTVIENLKADAEKKLAKICKPLRSYSADVQDLSRNTDYKILAYETGDTITLVDKESNTKEKQRIINKVKYLNEPEKDTVVIANRARYLGDEQEKIVENLRNSFNITKASLELFEDSIYGRVTEIEGTVTDLEDDYEGFKGETEAKIIDNTTEIEALATELTTKVSQTEYDGDYKEINKTYAEFRQDFESFKNTIQIGGGNNVIKNSVGYGEDNHWKWTVGVDGDLGFGVSTRILQGVSKHGWFLSDTVIMYQDIDLLPNTEYTLSGRLYKITPLGIVSIGLYDIETEELVYEAVNKNNGETFDGEFSLQFNSEKHSRLRLKIQTIRVSIEEPVELTDLMLGQGQNYDVWSQASGEIYTLNVKVDSEGIKVYNEDGKGLTVMSPEEFAGYYNNQKVFTLNRDITEVMGLYVGGKGLFIPPVKFVQTNESLDIVWTGR